MSVCLAPDRPRKDYSGAFWWGHRGSLHTKLEGGEEEAEKEEEAEHPWQREPMSQMTRSICTPSATPTVAIKSVCRCYFKIRVILLLPVVAVCLSVIMKVVCCRFIGHFWIREERCLPRLSRCGHKKKKCGHFIPALFRKIRHIRHPFFFGLFGRSRVLPFNKNKWSS